MVGRTVVCQWLGPFHVFGVVLLVRSCRISFEFLRCVGVIQKSDHFGVIVWGFEHDSAFLFVRWQDGTVSIYLPWGKYTVATSESEAILNSSAEHYC